MRCSLDVPAGSHAPPRLKQSSMTTGVHHNAQLQRPMSTARGDEDSEDRIQLTSQDRVSLDYLNKTQIVPESLEEAGGGFTSERTLLREAECSLGGWDGMLLALKAEEAF